MLRVVVAPLPEHIKLDLVELQGTLNITVPAPPPPPPTLLSFDVVSSTTTTTTTAKSEDCSAAPQPNQKEKEERSETAHGGSSERGGEGGGSQPPLPHLYASLGSITRHGAKAVTLHIGTLFVEGEATANKKTIVVLKKLPPSAASPKTSGNEKEDNDLFGANRSSFSRKRSRDDTAAIDQRSLPVMLLEEYLNLPATSTGNDDVSHSPSSGNDNEAGGGTFTKTADVLAQQWAREVNSLPNGYEMVGLIRDHYTFRAKPSRTFS